METEAERLARLSGRDQAAIAAARAAEERKYYAQFTFKPAINEPSSGSAAAADRPRRTAAERSRNEEGARARMRAAALAEAEFRAQHPFRPQLATGSDTGGGNAFRLAPASDPAHLAERMREHQLQKEAKREAARRLVECVGG